MKKTLSFILLLGGATSMFAQGQVNLQSYVGSFINGGFSTTIYSEDYAHPGEAEIMGNTPNDSPPGPTVYPLETPIGGATSGAGPGISGEYNGNNYTVGFYFATSASALQTAVNSGVPGYTISIVTNTGAGSGGYYDVRDTAIIYTIPNDPVGTPTYLAMAAWYSAGGAASYSAAVAANVPHGDVFATNTFTSSVAPYVPPTLAGLGLTSFNLVVNVPEPSITEFGAIAACSLLFLKRKGSN